MAPCLCPVQAAALDELGGDDVALDLVGALAENIRGASRK
jgi:hypothetical protein